MLGRITVSTDCPAYQKSITNTTPRAVLPQSFGEHWILDDIRELPDSGPVGGGVPSAVDLHYFALQLKLEKARALHLDFHSLHAATKASPHPYARAIILSSYCTSHHFAQYSGPTAAPSRPVPKGLVRRPARDSAAGTAADFGSASASHANKQA